MSETNILKTELMELAELMKKMTKVVKPPGPPKIWETVEKTSKDGRPIKFTIQEIPEDRNEDAVEHMCTYFLAGEPICACFNAVNTPILVEEYKILWRYMLKQGISIAAFVDNPNESKPIMAGLNILYMEYTESDKKREKLHFQSKFRITYEVMSKLSKSIRLFERYGVDEYMFSVGLSVAPPYRGYGLSTDILKVRDKIGHEYNISLTSSMFTSPFSVKAAERAGFEVLLTKDYADLVDENGKEYFPGIQKYSNSVLIMAKRIK